MTRENARSCLPRDADATGLEGVAVKIADNSFSSRFSLKELGKKGRNADAPVVFSAETRAGVQSTGLTGLIDQLPDATDSITTHFKSARSEHRSEPGLLSAQSAGSGVASVQLETRFDSF